MRQTWSLIVVFLCASIAGNTQSTTKNLSAVTDLTWSRVVNDYPNNFQNIMGEPLTENPQTKEFGSNVCPVGADRCVITQYSAKGKSVYSWEAKMLPLEDFSKAKAQYRSLFTEVSSLEIRIAGQVYRLSGSYKEPSESLRYNSIILVPDSKDKSIRKLKVEIVLEADMLEWNTRVIVYDREREDNERGSIYEN